MRSAARFALLVAVLIASVAAWPAGQVPPPQPIQSAQQPPPAMGTGFIAGQVVDSAGKPISEATVMVNGMAPAPAAGRGGVVPPQTPVTTDAQGRFFFANLPAGNY